MKKVLKNVVPSIRPYLGDAKTYLKIYDISTGVMEEVKTPDDYESIEFLVGDVIFYYKSTFDNEYLFSMKF